MINTIFLIFPVFVGLFWSVTLIVSHRNLRKPQKFLSGIMLVSALALTCHYLHLSADPDNYLIFDFASTCGGLIIFPLYHIYFRLLTIDVSLSWKIHARYLVLPIAVSLVYTVDSFINPEVQNRLSFFQEIGWKSASPAIMFMEIVLAIAVISFIIQLVTFFFCNQLLFNKFNKNSAHRNLDPGDTDRSGLRMLNYTVLLMGLAWFASILPGSYTILPKELALSIMSTITSSSVFIMGLHGVRQHNTKAAFEIQTSQKNLSQSVQSSTLHNIYISKIPKDQLMNRIIDEFERKKIYLNSELGINDVARSIGSNRTYISAVIKENFQQNFPGFVNGFRLKELERKMIDDTRMTTEKIAETCGFGTVNSMKRAVFSKTGLSFQEYRKQFKRNEPEI